MACASLAVVASLAVGPLPHGFARVLRVETAEAMDASYRATIDVALRADDLDPHELVLAFGELVFARADDGVVARRLAGLVTRVREIASPSPGEARATIVLESPLAALALGTDHRLFQQQSAIDVARTLVTEAGVAPELFAARLRHPHPAREVWTQLGETGFDFLSRVLEEDGVSYLFEHVEAGARLVLVDDVSALPSAGALRLAGAEGLVGGASFSEIVEVERLRPARVTLGDHDFAHPSLDLEVAASSASPLGRELYEAPGRYRTPAEGRRRAALRMAALVADASAIRLGGAVSALAPGSRFVLEGSSRDGEYVARSLAIAWDEGEAGASTGAATLVAVPADRPLAPASKTPRPRAPGPTLARVRGPRGAEIHCDEHGRVKVAFDWDRRATHDGRSSGWARVAQAALGGAIAIPRVGWEVLVDFEGGDPDAPVVIGRLDNGAFPPPYALPAGSAVSALGSASSPGGGGANEIRFSDTAGAEQVAIRAEADLTLSVAANRREAIGQGESRVVAGSQSTTIAGDRAVSLGAVSSIAVTGALSEAVGGARDESVGGDAKRDVKGARTRTVGGSHTRSTPATIAVTSGGSLSEVVGGSVIEAAGQAISTAVAGSASFVVAGSKVVVAGSGVTDTTIGARATTVGGSAIAVAGGDLAVGSAGVKATTVGGAWVATAGGDVELTAASSVAITVGGAIALTAGRITLAVGGSKVTLAGGAISIESPSVKLAATGPHVEAGPMIEDN
jgi:type VI secretion system secreted protein VgrG